MAQLLQFSSRLRTKISNKSFDLDPSYYERKSISSSSLYIQDSTWTTTCSSESIQSSDHINPWELIQKDIEKMNKGIFSKLTSEEPLLQKIAQYYFKVNGKRIRPVIIALMSAALDSHQSKRKQIHAIIRDPNEYVILNTQLELAQIVEMIHTASLIHDDVVDETSLRRNVQSINVSFGNKLAILGGDYIFAQISVYLTELQSFEVMRLMSTALAELIQGELMQIKPSMEEMISIDYYLKKSYYKTASLISNGCASAAILGNHESELVHSAREYGRHLGIAFQLIDDVLDYSGITHELGKPLLSDLKSGLITAPILFALEEHKHIRELVGNMSPEQVQMTCELVNKGQGIQKTRDLAHSHIIQAREAISILEDSPFKQGLIDITEIVLTRRK